MAARGRCGWRGSCMLETARDDARRGESIAESVEDDTDCTEAGAAPQQAVNTKQECNCHTDPQVGAKALHQATVPAQRASNHGTERRVAGATETPSDATQTHDTY